MTAEFPSRVALLGWPLGHSVSPAMHNAAFAVLGLDWHYELMAIEPGCVAEAIARLRTEGYRGANVTVPHKRAVLLHLDELTTAAQEIGAVNTLVEQQGQWIGHNTDAAGFALALNHAGFEILGCRAVVVGAGGGARAAVYGLLLEGAEKIVVLNRNLERAEMLAYDLDGGDGGSSRVEPLLLTPETLIRAAADADLLVNTTPLGMWPQVDTSIWPAGVPLPARLTVLDLVYNPYETWLLQQARAAGARPIGGLEMLVRQGALALELWTGRHAPLAIMRESALAALSQHTRKPYASLSNCR